MNLLELGTGETGVVVKVHGHGSFRKRLVEMGFVTGKKVRVILNAPLKDPIEYEILGYKLSLRREEARKIEVISEAEAREAASNPALHSEYCEPDDGDWEPVMARMADAKKHEIRVALVGNPNCGKTSLFNLASGSHEHVGNYSGVTVDAKEGRFEYGGYKFIFTDLPGTYSISPYSPEELYVRKHLIENVPDVVINVVDASNLERNLYLTTQLIDLNLRTVLALNMYDELKDKGDKIDLDQFAVLLGMPVCPTVCRTGQGVNGLLDTVIKVYEQKVPTTYRHIHINHGTEVEASIDRIKLILQKDPDIRAKYSTRYLAIKYLENDPEIGKVVENTPERNEIITAKVEEQSRIEDLMHVTTEAAIVDAKYAFISGALKETYVPHVDKKPRLTVTDKIDAVVTNKWLAFPIFIFLLYIMFVATFSLGQYPMDWIDWLVNQIGRFVATFMREGWLKSLVVDGIIAGVGSVLVFLPNILILYFFISLMSDTGYMARAAFIVDKLMHKIGLHGKSFIPMVMGFGCNVPAIMATRAIESPKSRFITILILPFVSCAGRLPVFVLLAGAFFGKHAPLALLGIYLLGIVLAIVSAKVLAKFVRDDDLPFVMELPPYRVPTGKALWRHTWEQGKQYLQKMSSTILICSIIIWFLGYFPRNAELIEVQNVYAESMETVDHIGALPHPSESSLAEAAALREEMTSLEPKLDSLYSLQQEESYIGWLGKLVAPALEPMGFNWKMDVGLLTGIAAKELVVSSLGVMYAQGSKVSGGDDLSHDTALQTALVKSVSLPSAIAFMVFILLYFPCIATFVAIKTETGKWKYAIWSCVYTMVIAWVMSFLAFHIASLLI